MVIILHNIVLLKFAKTVELLFSSKKKCEVLGVLIKSMVGIFHSVYTYQIINCTVRIYCNFICHVSLNTVEKILI